MGVAGVEAVQLLGGQGGVQHQDLSGGVGADTQPHPTAPHPHLLLGLPPILLLQPGREQVREEERRRERRLERRRERGEERERRRGRRLERREEERRRERWNNKQ